MVKYQIQEVVPNYAKGTIGYYIVNTHLLQDETTFDTFEEALEQVKYLTDHDDTLYPLTIVTLYS